VSAEALEEADVQVERLASLEDSNGVRTEFDAELVQEKNEVEADAEAEGDVPEGFVKVRNPKETKMYARLGKDIQRSLSTTEHGQAVEEEEEGKTEVDGKGERRVQRTHPLRQLGWFGMFPGMTVTPASIARPTAALLSTANKHLDDAIFRILGPTLEKTPVRTKHSDNAYDAIPLDTSHGMGSIGSGGKETNRAKGSHHLHRRSGGDGQDRIRGTGPRPTVRAAGEKMDREAERKGP